MKGRPNKFNARKQPCQHGHVHDSGREAKRCNELHILLRAGEIERLEQQPKYWFEINGKQVKHPNGRRVGFTPDFRYWDRLSGTQIVEDAKGVRTEAYVLRAAIFRALHPDIVLREV